MAWHGMVTDTGDLYKMYEDHKSGKIQVGKKKKKYKEVPALLVDFDVDFRNLRELLGSSLQFTREYKTIEDVKFVVRVLKSINNLNEIWFMSGTKLVEVSDEENAGDGSEVD